MLRIPTACMIPYMSDFEEISFVIPGHSPETIPLDRLIEYLQQMVTVLGDPNNLHLVEIRQSSVSPVLHTSKKDALELRERAMQVQRGQGTPKQNKAYNTIRRMVRCDVRGTNLEGRNVVLRDSSRVILEIPPAQEESEVIEGLKQATSVDGQLIKVGGPKEDAVLQIRALDGEILSGFTAKRSLAKELAHLLWGPTIRLSGVGVWSRDIDGIWRLSSMHVQSFELLEDDEAMVTLERLRKLNVNWPLDALERLHEERGGT